MATSDPMTQYADTILVNGWCLRSGLVRYAQAEPLRSTTVHGLMRRLDAVLGSATSDRLVELSAIVARFEGLALAISQWAADRSAHELPNNMVDQLLGEIPQLFDEFNVPEESMDPSQWRGARSSEGRRVPKAKIAVDDPGSVPAQ